MLKVACENLIIHNTPLAKMAYDGVTLTVEFDDECLRRCRAVFSPVQAFRSTSADCFDMADIISSDVCLSEGIYTRYIFEKTASPLDMRASRKPL